MFPSQTPTCHPRVIPCIRLANRYFQENFHQSYQSVGFLKVTNGPRSCSSSTNCIMLWSCFLDPIAKRLRKKQDMASSHASSLALGLWCEWQGHWRPISVWVSRSIANISPSFFTFLVFFTVLFKNIDGYLYFKRSFFTGMTKDSLKCEWFKVLQCSKDRSGSDSNALVVHTPHVGKESISTSYHGLSCAMLRMTWPMRPSSIRPNWFVYQAPPEREIRATHEEPDHSRFPQCVREWISCL